MTNIGLLLYHIFYLFGNIILCQVKKKKGRPKEPRERFLSLYQLEISFHFIGSFNNLEHRHTQKDREQIALANHNFA